MNRINGTALSYSAIPNSVCNELFWNILLLLCYPKTAQELFEKYFDIKKVLVINAEIEPVERLNVKLLNNRYQLKLVMADINQLKLIRIDEQTTPTFLNRFIIHDQMLFDLTYLNSIRFKDHLSIYSLFETQYPDFAKKIYEANNDWVNLKHDIQLVNRDGLTLEQALKQLRDTLVISGTSYTGNELASPEAEQAYRQFKRYLSRFPKAFQNEVVALGGIKTLQMILDDLRQGSCVETAAKNIDELLSIRSTLLKDRPLLSLESVNKIEKNYGKNNPISIRGNDLSSLVPTEYSKALLSKIEIHTAHDYIDFLIQWPENEYELFFLTVSIKCLPKLPDELAMYHEMFSDSQRKAFDQVLLKHADVFGGFHAILRFSLCLLPHGDLFKKIIDKYDVQSNDMFTVLKQKDKDSFTLFHLYAIANDCSTVNKVLSFFK